ncbi:hypothetical protein JYU34_018545 [Plutella xylostella]|uniref:Uncharacterized protein n=1 Tax=Plutella xylostella TaxID=51655 RepID=A0ABQ7PXT8_PLUXY|nr:hypothetical protein JYU34_018545 [Plutella xylostella]
MRRGERPRASSPRIKGFGLRAAANIDVGYSNLFRRAECLGPLGLDLEPGSRVI